jgi:hypothetical protein
LTSGEKVPSHPVPPSLFPDLPLSPLPASPLLRACRLPKQPPDATGPRRRVCDFGRAAAPHEDTEVDVDHAPHHLDEPRLVRVFFSLAERPPEIRRGASPIRHCQCKSSAAQYLIYALD